MQVVNEGGLILRRDIDVRLTYGTYDQCLFVHQENDIIYIVADTSVDWFEYHDLILVGPDNVIDYTSFMHGIDQFIVHQGAIYLFHRYIKATDTLYVEDQEIGIYCRDQLIGELVVRRNGGNYHNFCFIIRDNKLYLHVSHEVEPSLLYEITPSSIKPVAYHALIKDIIKDPQHHKSGIRKIDILTDISITTNSCA